MRSYRARNVVIRVAPQDNLYHTELREQKGGARAHRSGGWRMTGSAGRADRFDTISFSLKGGCRGGNARGCAPRGGWRMTGSAFASYERRGTLCLSLAPQDNFLRRGRSGGGGCRDCAGSAGWRILCAVSGGNRLGAVFPYKTPAKIKISRFKTLPRWDQDRPLTSEWPQSC